MQWAKSNKMQVATYFNSIAPESKIESGYCLPRSKKMLVAMHLNSVSGNSKIAINKSSKIASGNVPYIRSCRVKNHLQKVSTYLKSVARRSKIAKTASGNVHLLRRQKVKNCNWQKSQVAKYLNSVAAESKVDQIVDALLTFGNSTLKKNGLFLFLVCYLRLDQRIDEQVEG